nr:hypothetical protein [Nonomuraea coxensis]
MEPTYAARPGALPRNPAVETMFTMTPPLRPSGRGAAMRRAASRAPTKTPRAFTANTWSHVSSLISSRGTAGKMPALFTQISRPPSSVTARSAGDDRAPSAQGDEFGQGFAGHIGSGHGGSPSMIERGMLSSRWR